MPIYEYRCKECGRVSEFLVGVGKETIEIKCVHCGSKIVEKIFSKSYIAKSGVSYSVNGGKTCCGRDERCDIPPCSNNGTCRRELSES